MMKERALLLHCFLFFIYSSLNAQSEYQYDFACIGPTEGNGTKECYTIVASCPEEKRIQTDKIHYGIKNSSGICSTIPADCKSFQKGCCSHVKTDQIYEMQLTDVVPIMELCDGNINCSFRPHEMMVTSLQLNDFLLYEYICVDGPGNTTNDTAIACKNCPNNLDPEENNNETAIACENCQNTTEPGVRSNETAVDCNDYPVNLETGVISNETEVTCKDCPDKRGSGVKSNETLIACEDCSDTLEPGRKVNETTIVACDNCLTSLDLEKESNETALDTNDFQNLVTGTDNKTTFACSDCANCADDFPNYFVVIAVIVSSLLIVVVIVILWSFLKKRIRLLEAHVSEIQARNFGSDYTGNRDRLHDSNQVSVVNNGDINQPYLTPLSHYEQIPMSFTNQATIVDYTSYHVDQILQSNQ